MMMSLFSVFDPVTWLGVSFNWCSVFIVVVMMMSSVIMVDGRVESVKTNFKGSVGKIFREVGGKNWSMMGFLSLVLFIWIGVMNLLGLWPFVFVGTSHLVVTLGMGLVLWFSFLLLGWIKNVKESSSHLVPEGSPMFLAPIMVIIEMISHLIRPVTLSVRLAANMMAGHMIIGLISGMSMGGVGGMMVSIFFQSMMVMLEIGVALIQAFVFSVLVLLYSTEYY
uniref:ATP synthase subunit a n=1 Tax=Phyxioschema suthepium TaxID=1155482 RepID=L7NVY8_9ARAC|nr:ATP synthase F0 subunit 6 [Phyxioschema suthepium]AFC77860.1 ATP synthase F0 subunit 6 [Phyxioschema suthepium]